MLLLADFPYWRMPYCGVPLDNNADDKIVIFKNSMVTSNYVFCGIRILSDYI